MISVLYNIILITNFKLIEMCIKSSPFGEGKGEGPLPHRGISVITPLPLGEGKGEGPAGEMGRGHCLLWVLCVR